MAKDPAVLFYTSDFLSGVTFLSMEERGQYITLLCIQHQKHSIPLNHMISVCGSDDSSVFKLFTRDEDGSYYHHRMRLEAEKRAKYCASRSNNKSGRPKKESYDKSYDNHTNNHMENENRNGNIVKNKKEKKENPLIAQIIDYLNTNTNKSFSCKSAAATKKINARLAEGYGFEEFKKVIDVKKAEWMDDEDMNKYLRPETLFSEKFDSYLNQATSGKSKLKELEGMLGRKY